MQNITRHILPLLLMLLFCAPTLLLAQRFGGGDGSGSDHGCTIIMVGLDDPEPAIDLVLHPVPVREFLRVQLSDAGQATTLEVHDLAGRRLLSRAVAAEPEHVIDVRNWTAGMYHLVIRGDEFRIVRKFIVR